MDLSEKIIVALIAGLVSLVVAMLGFLATYFQHKASRKKLEKEFENKFIEKLYIKRAELYPTAFDHVSRIRRLKKPEGIIPKEYQDSILKDLNIWTESEAGLFMSDDVIKAYYELRKVLGKNPGNGQYYTDIQIEKIWNARVNFRVALRRDLGSLHGD